MKGRSGTRRAGSDHWPKVAVIVQSAIVALMVVALWQTPQALELTRNQIQALTMPVLDPYWQPGDTLYLRNITAVPAVRFEVRAILAAQCGPSWDVTRYHVSGATHRLVEKVGAGDTLAVCLPEALGIFADSTVHSEAFCIVFRYFRAVDMRVAYLPYYFMSSRTTSATERTRLRPEQSG